jgi:hypothetical protein
MVFALEISWQIGMNFQNVTSQGIQSSVSFRAQIASEFLQFQLFTVMISQMNVEIVLEGQFFTANWTFKAFVSFKVGFR